MKTDVEELSPTRVRLSVEVSFEELKPSLDKAYKEVAQQARIPGFRPGKVPPRVIDMRIGRGAVLSEAVNDALPEFYSKAVQEAEVFVLGQPDVEITQLEDGKELSFTAEVEVRPKFELPDLTTLTVTVDGAEVTDEDIDEYLTSLRERFASLKGVQRAAEDGDYVTLDLSAAVDGELVEDAQATGLSYQVGSGEMLEGLDEAITGPANYRATQPLDGWLKSHGMTGICGVDTRRLTRLIRDRGAPNGVIAYRADSALDIAALQQAYAGG